MSGSMRLSWRIMRSGWVGKVWSRLGLFGLSLMRLGSRFKELRDVCYLSINFTIVKCHSFCVLTKALFFH
jgi:hypothetical protein